MRKIISSTSVVLDMIRCESVTDPTKIALIIVGIDHEIYHLAFIMEAMATGGDNSMIGQVGIGLHVRTGGVGFASPVVVGGSVGRSPVGGRLAPRSPLACTAPPRFGRTPLVRSVSPLDRSLVGRSASL